MKLCLTRRPGRLRSLILLRSFRLARAAGAGCTVRPDPDPAATAAEGDALMMMVDATLAELRAALVAVERAERAMADARAGFELEVERLQIARRAVADVRARLDRALLLEALTERRDG